MPIRNRSAVVNPVLIGIGQYSCATGYVMCNGSKTIIRSWTESFGRIL